MCIDCGCSADTSHHHHHHHGAEQTIRVEQGLVILETSSTVTGGLDSWYHWLEMRLPSPVQG